MNVKLNKNQVQLITYVDRLSSGNLQDLKTLLNNQLSDLFGGVHLLPFFDAIDGEDAGFDPIDHTKVDERLGDWSDVADLSKDYVLMADMIVNHMSSESPQFKDFLQKGEASSFKNLFLRYSDVFPNGAAEEELLNIYRPRPGLPITRFTFEDGETSFLWTTFTAKQIDINVFNEEGEKYLDSVLQRLYESGVKLIRLDAAGYAVKVPGTSCFMIPETFDFIDAFSKKAHALDMQVLVEIHSHYKKQIEIAKKTDWVYDFALPPLILHALYASNAKGLKNWLTQSPRNCITVLDTHDGIGIIDVAQDSEGNPGILNKEEIDCVVEGIHLRSKGESKKATGASARNLDLYQVNCTFYDALGQNDNDYLLARLIQFCCPGIPQIYYTGLLAGCNDMKLLDKTGVGRDINRHFYSMAEINKDIERPVVKNLFELIRFRNSHPAFNGVFELGSTEEHQLKIDWVLVNTVLTIYIDLSAKTFVINSSINGKTISVTCWEEMFLLNDTQVAASQA